MGQQLQHLFCEAGNCPKKRRGVSPHCHGHELRKHRYGHPLGKALERHIYKQELAEVRSFFDEQQDHPAIGAAVQLFDQWKRQAGTKEALAGQGIFLRLHNHDISSLDILIEVSAVWLYSERNPSQLPDDIRLDYAMARNAARLAGFHRKAYGTNVSQLHPRGTELRAAGDRIRQLLSRFFVNLVAALKAKADQAKATRQDLATPFNSNNLKE